MKKRTFLGLTALLLTVAALTMGMGRRGQYDYEAREEERIAKINHNSTSQREPATHVFASGVKDIATAPTHMLSEAAQSAGGNNSVDGAIDAVNTGSEHLLNNAVKGTVKVATLGFGNLKSYEIEEPAAGSGDTTKIKIKIPGT